MKSEMKKSGLFWVSYFRLQTFFICLLADLFFFNYTNRQMNGQEETQKAVETHDGVGFKIIRNLVIVIGISTAICYIVKYLIE